MLGCSIKRSSIGLLSNLTGPGPSAVKQGGGVTNQLSSIKQGSGWEGTGLLTQSLSEWGDEVVGVGDPGQDWKVQTESLSPTRCSLLGAEV